jgi:hypothetical protein
MSKKIGWLALAAVVASLGIVAVVALAGEDPTEIRCADEFAAVGSVMPSADGVHSTPAEAAARFAAVMEADGQPIPAETEVVSVGGSDAAAETADEKEFAVRVEGETLALLRVGQEAGGWAVQGFTSC